MNSPRVTCAVFFGLGRRRLLSRLTLAVACVAFPSGTNVVIAREPPPVAGLTVGDCEQLLKSDQSESRRRGAATLAQFGSAAVGPLGAALQSPDAAVRVWAARGLRPVAHDAAWTVDGRTKATSSLRSALRDPSPSVQIAAAGSLIAHQSDVDAALKVLGQALDSPIAGARIESMSELDRAGEAARPLLARIAAAEDVPQHGDYVKRLGERIVGRLEASK